MKTKLTLVLALISVSNFLFSQVGLGTISGYVYTADDSTTTIPLARIWVETESGNRFAQSDIDGSYKINGLKPGIYNLTVAHKEYDTIKIASIMVYSDGITNNNVYCSNDNLLTAIVITHNRVKIETDIPRIQVLMEDIDHSLNIRDPKALLAGMSSEVKMVEGTSDVIIRGSRPGDAIFYIDGVKANDMSSIPGASVQGLEAYTGGIPAKYGDTTGGVVVLETKGYFDLYYQWKANN
jgi:hypothetical protein